MEALLQRQAELTELLNKLKINFKKDSSARKSSPEYISKKIEHLDNLWSEFELNHTKLMEEDDKTHEYFTEKIYDNYKEFYKMTKQMISSSEESKSDKCTQLSMEVLDLINQQRTNFRAFLRIVNGLDDDINDKWEIEDELRNLQSRWDKIDDLHWKIDNLLQGSENSYDQEFGRHEKTFKSIKKSLNQKLTSVAHLSHSTPKIEIPTFHGNYTQWSTFSDLFKEAIHNNPMISKTQKMQHLKGKLRGEAERLIQHLQISADNYDTAWQIINRRFDNTQLLFSKQIEVFLNQPTIQKQTAYDLKRLHDVSSECIYAIHNLGVDTNTWDPLLVHLICKKLDIQTYSDYKQARVNPRELPSLQEFMTFLESKFLALEPISKKDKTEHSAKTHFSLPNKVLPRFKLPENKPYFDKPNYNATFYAHTDNKKCILCNLDHALFQCKKFESLNPDMRLNIVTKNNFCINCLYYHERNYCKSTKRCKDCNKAHNTLLHAAFPCTSKTESDNMNKMQKTYNDRNSRNTNHVANNINEILLTTVQLRVKRNDGTFMTFCALLDQGSQTTMITENAAQLLNLPRQRFSGVVSGIGISSSKCKGKLLLECNSIHDNYSFTTEALIMPKLVNNLPNNSFNKNTCEHLCNIQLADPEYYRSKPIDILLDAKVYSEIIMDGLLKGSPQQPIAQQTKLGWILSGSVTTFNCSVVLNNLNDISRYWEIEDIPETLTEPDNYCEKLYTETTKRLPDGKYEVWMPMKENFEEKLGESKSKTVAQFKQLEKRFSKDPQLHDNYKKFIHEYIDMGHMTRSLTSKHPSCYLPHHPVVKEDSTTTKLRVVFNGSAKTQSGNSLNDLMECGPKLQQDIMTLLLKWRNYKIGCTADCEKHYRSISVIENHQHLQKIVWRDSPEAQLTEYQLTTVTYGMKAAPFLAMRTMKQLAIDDGDKYPLAANVLQNNLYVDDVIFGCHTLTEAEDTQTQLIDMCNGAGINLRKWASNDKSLLTRLPDNQVNPSIIDFKTSDTTSTKTLGLRWDPNNDTFQFRSNIDFDIKIEQCTKRKFLSEISMLYDPLGWLAPVTVKAKILFQQVWEINCEWDDNLPEEILQEWIALRNDIKNIDKFNIPRHIGDIQNDIEIHAFCDSSEKAYAASIYIKTTDSQGQIVINLITAKTKLAPLKKSTTLPRLELCGALLLTKLLKKVIETLQKSNDKIKIYAWTDSMIVLGWINGEPSRWNSFVANRVKQITESLPAAHWRHVQSQDNAADCATRGMTPSQLLIFTLWWEGPSWLKDDIPENTNYLNIPTTLEIKNIKMSLSTNVSYTILSELLHKHSNLTRAVRILCWVLRFKASNDKTNYKECKHLTTYELNKARNLFIESEQVIAFANEIHDLKEKGCVSKNSCIKNLNPFLDDNNLLRVGGRLEESSLPSASKHPVLLPNNSRLTELVINEAHDNTLHGGARLTLAYIRNKYWLISGNRIVKKQIRKCVKCHRFRATAQGQFMADLPQARITPSRPFTHTGVDFTGHVAVKANKGRGIKTTKGYIAVFVCFCTKAVHLELVSDLTTDSFLAAFKRLCARRGMPKHVYSDNGTNFVGASRILKDQYKEALRLINTDFLTNVADMGVTWHFNAPLWPSAGGLWEAAVKSLKYHLRRVIGEQKLTFEEFTTLLTQIEACLNSRPLIALPDSYEEDYLSPSHYLIGEPILSTPLTDEHSIGLKTRWDMLERMHRCFWTRWSVEYLHQLQTRSKWFQPNNNLKLDDVVLVREDNLPPTKWALGRVTDLHPGKDGRVRVVTLQTKNGLMKRPVIKLSPLPLEQESTCSDKPDDINVNQAKQTPSNDKPSKRRSGKPKSLFMTFLLMMMTFFTSTIAQPYNLTSLNSTNTLYFDKFANMHVIQDEWNLIVYINMTTYWQGFEGIQNYVQHLRLLCNKYPEPQYVSIVAQLEHELTEIDHYNKLLTNAPSRTKRGLINVIGNIANSLFGVLDDKFAEQYQKDIELTRINEKHLLKLIKNQTSILEAENNILQRNEAIMNNQFQIINRHLQNITQDIQEIKYSSKSALDGLYILSTSLSANAIISNIRRIQESLIDTVTDIYHGRFDIHLLSPTQIEDQLNTISGNLQGDLMIPGNNVREIYHLLKIKARVTPTYLILEVKIPLLSRSKYELNHVIPIPRNKENQQVYVIPTTSSIAFNIDKDIFISLTETDLQNCITYRENNLLCSISQPIYNMDTRQSICAMKIKSITSYQLYCHSEIRECSDMWIRLHSRGAWLFSCCQECSVRILCTNDLHTLHLKETGIISVMDGCSIKGEAFTIPEHRVYESIIEVHSKLTIPKFSMSQLNHYLNSSLAESIVLNPMESHDDVFNRIRGEIDTIKEQQHLEELSTSDVHHYVMIYVILTIMCAAITVLVYVKWRKAKKQVKTVRSDVENISLHDMRTYSVSALSVDKATSPVVTRNIKFNKDIFN